MTHRVEESEKLFSREKCPLEVKRRNVKLSGK